MATRYASRDFSRFEFEDSETTVTNKSEMMKAHAEKVKNSDVVDSDEEVSNPLHREVVQVKKTQQAKKNAKNVKATHSEMYKEEKQYTTVTTTKKLNKTNNQFQQVSKKGSKLQSEPFRESTTVCNSMNMDRDIDEEQPATIKSSTTDNIKKYAACCVASFLSCGMTGADLDGNCGCCFNRFTLCGVRCQHSPSVALFTCCLCCQCWPVWAREVHLLLDVDEVTRYEAPRGGWGMTRWCISCC